MKRFNIIILIILGAVSMTSCDSDRDSNPILQDPTTFVLNTPAYASTVYDLKHSETIELTCSQPDYGFTVATDYVAQVSLTGEFNEAVDENTPATYQTLSSIYNTAKMNIDAQELAIAIVNLSGITEIENFYTSPIKVYIRLKASVNSGMKPILSNIIELPNVLTYFALDPMVMPGKMYVTGTISGWDWSKAYSLVPVYGTPGKFWTLKYFDANAEIKFNSEKSWNGAEFGYVGTTISDKAGAQIEDNGGNIKIVNAGWYIVVVTTTIEGRSYKYAVEFVTPIVYVCGATVGDKWGSSGEAFTNPANGDGEFVSPTLPKGGELRLCVVLEGHEWWHTEFIFFDGKIAYRAAGGDQDRVTVDAGKKVYLNFMTETGRVE